MTAGPLRTIAYIDGFNLYYRMLKDRPAMKWLNPKALIDGLLHPSFEVTRINYYTARISARAHDPDGPARQAIYLKALSTVPEISVHAGNFLISKTWMPLASPPRGKMPLGPSQTVADEYVWSLPPPNVVK